MIHAKTEQESNYLPAECLYKLNTGVKSTRKNPFFGCLDGYFKY